MEALQAATSDGSLERGGTYMRRTILGGLFTLVSFLSSLQPVFGQDSYFAPAKGASLVVQVRIGGDPYYREGYQECGYYRRHECGRHKECRHHDCDDRYYCRHSKRYCRY